MFLINNTLFNYMNSDSNIKLHKGARTQIRR